MLAIHQVRCDIRVTICANCFLSPSTAQDANSGALPRTGTWLDLLCAHLLVRQRLHYLTATDLS